MKTLVLSVLAVLTASLAFAAAPVQTIDTSGQPTIGSPQAPVQVVAFLEPKCPDSKQYHNNAFLKLQTEYLNSNKVRYTVITTSFLSQSMPAAIALLCIYHQDPSKPQTDLFFKYLDYIYKHQPPEKENWATTETLLKFAASASPSIDQARLKKCIEGEDYLKEVKKNTALGNQLMGHLSTPAIYVNGVKVENNKDDTIDYDKIKAAVEQALQK